MPSLTIEKMIKEDMGYCCLFAFFSIHRDTQVIADRLGVTTRAVRYHKMMFKQGDYICQNQPKCLQCRL